MRVALEEDRDKEIEMLKRLICWWFGCVPDYRHPSCQPGSPVVPCLRCGAPDTDYSDCVGDTRHRRMIEGLHDRLLWWWPEKCPDCGKRFGRHEACDTLPF